jgi:hypothetical protein
MAPLASRASANVTRANGARVFFILSLLEEQDVAAHPL